MEKSYKIRNAVGTVVACLFYYFVCRLFVLSMVFVSATALYVETLWERAFPQGFDIILYGMTHVSCFLIGLLICKKDQKDRRIGLILSGVFVLVALLVTFFQIGTADGLITPFYICSAILAAAFLLTGLGLFARLRNQKETVTEGSEK